MRPENPPRLHGLRGIVVNWRDPEHHLAGGSERYAWELSRALREAGASIDFMTSRDAGQSRGDVVDGINIRRAGGRLSFYLWTLVFLLRRRRRTDFVIDVENGLPAFAPLVLRRRTPVVLVMHHVHLDQFGTHFPAPVAAFGRFLEGRVMPRVYSGRSVIAVSESTEREMRTRLGWTGPIEVIHNGTDFLQVDHQPGDGRVAVLGRLVAHKRVDLVIEAAHRLREEGRVIRVDVIGRGPEEAVLRALVDRLAVDDIVTLHGFVDVETKADLLARAQLHVCASEGEGWGQVVLEAAGTGVPTLAYAVPGLRDSIRDRETGWLLPVDARATHEQLTDGLAAGIGTALDQLDDPEQSEQLAKACREWAAAFTWEAMRAAFLGAVARQVER